MSTQSQPVTTASGFFLRKNTHLVGKAGAYSVSFNLLKWESEGIQAAPSGAAHLPVTCSVSAPCLCSYVSRSRRWLPPTAQGSRQHLDGKSSLSAHQNHEQSPHSPTKAGS